MQSVRKIGLEIINLGYMRGVLETYEELAAARMQMVRTEMLAAREFYQGLTSLSEDIGADIMNVVGVEAVIPAYVLFSSNSGMFGDLPERLVTAFVQEIKGRPGDVFVIGEMGAKLLKQVLPNQDFRVLPIPNEELQASTLALILEQLRAYRKIKIFYSQFINLVRQEVASRDLSGELTLSSLGKKDLEIKERRLKYLYEPSLEDVGGKLKTEVFGGVFEATVKESQLSKFAARLMHLDQSLANLDNWQKKMGKLKTKTRKKNNNKKQGLRVAAAGWSA